MEPIIMANVYFPSPVASNGNEKPNTERRPSRFYIDDILATDFGPLSHRSVDLDVNVNHWNLEDTSQTGLRNCTDDIDSVVSLNNGIGIDSELVSLSGLPLRSSTIVTSPPRPPSCQVTSSRRCYDRSRNNNRQTTKDIVKVESCSSTSAEVRNDYKTVTNGYVTSSTTSLPAATTSHRNHGITASDKYRFTLPAWVYCTRYSDRPSAGPRVRRRRVDAGRRRRRHRTSFSVDQLRQLRAEYERCHYISDERRSELADKLGLDVNTVKIWFQNRRANDKKARGVRNELAIRLMADGLYNHHTANQQAS